MSNPSHIYHIAPYYPPHLGGLQTAVQNLATAQREAGHNVTVITSNRPRQSPQSQQDRLVLRLATLDFAHTPFIINLLPVMLRKITSKDIVHLHYAQPYLPEVVFLYSLMTRRQFIFHFHGDVLPSGRLGVLLAPYKRYVLPRTLKRATVVVFPSNAFRDRMLGLYPFLKTRQIAVIPNGIPLPEIATDKKAEPRYFLYVGRLADIKNVPFIIESFHLARQKMKNIKLIIVGSGEREASLKRLTEELEELSSIEFRGTLLQKDITKLYRQAYALLVASERESFGMGIVEAMAYGVPVIACHAAGVDELVIDGVNGYLCERSSSAFASRMVSLVHDKASQKSLAKSAVQTVRPYDGGRIAQQFDRLYTKVKSL